MHNSSGYLFLITELKLTEDLVCPIADQLEMSEDEDEMSAIDDAQPTELPKLRSLGLGGNDISDETAEAFGSMLLENDGEFANRSHHIFLHCLVQLCTL